MTGIGTTLGLVFATPWLAWAAVGAAAAPVAIHLLNRRRYRRVDWAAMEFLLAGRRRHRRRVRLEEWLLLALRTAAVLTIGLAVAGPRSSATPLPVGAVLAGDHVFVLDDSASMAARHGPASVFASARADLLAHLDAPGPAGPWALYRTSDAGEPCLALGPHDPAAARARIERLEPGDTRGGLAEALAGARAALADAPAPGHVTVLSDFRRNDWSGPAGQAVRAQLAALADAGVHVTLLDHGLDAPGNLTLEALRLAGPHAVAQAQTHLAVTVRNHGPEDVRDVPIRLRVGEVELPAHRIEAIPAHAERTVELPVVFTEPGPQAVQAELPGDALDADNAAWLALDVREALAVLVFDGHHDPANPRRSESFYLKAALDAARHGGLHIRTEVRPAHALGSADLAGADVVVLANVPDVPAELDADGQWRHRALEALEAFVRAGGGLAIFTGDRVNVAFYNGPLHTRGLVPLPLGNPVGDAAAREHAVSLLADASAELPMLRAFAGRGAAFARLIRIYRYHPPGRANGEVDLLDAGPPRVLLRFDDADGSPALVERRLGEGVVLAVHTSAGDRWNDWGKSINFTYLPVMVDMIAHLARARGLEHTDAVGVPIRHAGSAARAWLRTPAFPEQDLVALAPTGPAPDGGADLVYERPRQAGLYELTLDAPDGPGRVLFARNVDPAEGDLARPAPAELAALAGAGVRYVHRAGAVHSVDPATPAGRQYAGWLLAAALAMLGAEVLLAQRLGRGAGEPPTRRGGRGGSHG